MSRRTFLVEFLKASALNLLCLAGGFHLLLLKGHVASLQGGYPTSLNSMSEMVYITQPILSSQMEFMREGIFPAWTPYSQSGTPLIGKMQGGFFSPYHLPLYILPRSWLPYTLSLVVLLKAYLAFAFAYLFARALRLNFYPAFLGATLFLFSHLIMGQVFTWSGSGLYLPLILLLTELCLSARKKTALLLLPWAVAFPFFSGHFESAVRNNLVAAAYFISRLWMEPKGAAGEKLGQMIDYAAMMALGGLLASVQILPGIEYHNLSYNKVWHNPKWFNMLEHEIIGKHLSGEDLPMLVLGFAGLTLFVVLLKKSLRGDGRDWGRKAAMAAALAVTIAALAQTGLDDSLIQMTYSPNDNRIAQWLLGLSLLLFAFWSWAQEDQHPGLKALGGILIASLLVLYKTPVLSNTLLHTPVLGGFHNTTYRWEFNLALAFLAASAWQRIFAGSQGDWAQRRKLALRFFGFLSVFVAGYLASHALKPALVGAVATAAAPLSIHDNPALAGAGGFTGPEFPITYARHWTLAGWVPSYPPPVSVQVALLQGQTPVSQAPASLTHRQGRVYFKTQLPLSGAARAFARVEYAGQAPRILRGPEIDAQKRQWGRKGDLMLLGGVMLLPAVFLLGPMALKLGYALVLLTAVCATPLGGIPPEQIPYSLPGIAKIKEDKDLFRTYSLDYDFLQADYPNMYGLSDLRTGGDALDVLTMIYFSHILNSFLADPKAPRFETGMKLLGLANVKYLLEAPGRQPRHPALEPFYSGPDMTVFKNKFFMPRAMFYEKFNRLPLDNFLDWGSRERFLGPIVNWMSQDGMDFADTLLLNDSPSGSYPAQAPQDARGSARVDSYSPNEVRVKIDAPRPGIVALSDNFFPGWQAEISGRKAKILRSWATFRAIEVPAGVSELVLRYRPFMLRAGASVSVLLALLWSFFYRRHLLAGDSGAAAAPLPAVKGKKAQQADAATRAGPESVLCASLIQPFFTVMIAGSLLFWMIWCAFVYRESAAIALAARALLAAAAAITAWDYKCGRYSKAPRAP